MRLARLTDKGRGEKRGMDMKKNMTICAGIAVTTLAMASVANAGVFAYNGFPNSSGLTLVSDAGVSNNARPDFIVGTLNGFDAPAGLDNIFPWSPSSIPRLSSPSIPTKSLSPLKPLGIS